MIRGTNPIGYYGCIAAFLTLKFGDRIGNIKAPTLYISGADDHLGGPPEIMQGLADKVPGARHVSVPNAAHICNLQNPDGFNRVLTEFFKEGPAASRSLALASAYQAFSDRRASAPKLEQQTTISPGTNANDRHDQRTQDTYRNARRIRDARWHDRRLGRSDHDG